MVAKLILAAFLLAHGAIHASYLSPRPPVTAGGPQWPFELRRSWVLSPLGVDPEVTRLIGVALVAASVAGFALAALTTLGAAPALWSPAVVLGVVASVALLVLYFHPWLAIGLAIDGILLWAALAGWSPASAFTPS
jgi:hypothetical protein